jgi:DNA polymerase V
LRTIFVFVVPFCLQSRVGYNNEPCRVFNKISAIQQFSGWQTGKYGDARLLQVFPELSQTVVALNLPLYGSKVPAGFPSPADDHLETTIDLNRQFIRHPAATFFVRVQGDSMIGAGIHNNDVLVVDRSLEAKSGAIVIAVVNNELTVKRLILDGEHVCLMPENPHYEALHITEGMELHIWGVAVHVIHSLS